MAATRIVQVAKWGSRASRLGSLLCLAGLTAGILVGCTAGEATGPMETPNAVVVASASVPASVPVPPATSTGLTATAHVPSPARPTVTQTLDAATPTVRSSATVAPATPTVAPTVTPLPPTPHPLYPYTLAGLRAREDAGGTIRILRREEVTDAYTRYLIAYPSDGLTVTGSLQVPPGNGPFPTIILLHGFWPRAQYRPGVDSAEAAGYFNRQGYLTIAPDFRSWGESESGLSLFHAGLVADTLNLLNALPSLPQADPGQVGMWGHSMGGGIATKVLVVDGRVQAAVLYAPNSADDAELIRRWGPGCLEGQSEAAGDWCNPAEILPPGTPESLVRAYLEGATDPELLRQVAPLYHLDWVRAPVQIHIGTADGASIAETPPEWSETLFRALEQHGKEVEYFVYPDQGHFFTGESWQLLLERAAAFFDLQLQATR